MSEARSEGFDPLKIQAENKAKALRSAELKKKIRKVSMALLLPVLIVAGMYAVGGTAHFSKWRAVRKQLTVIGRGDSSAVALRGLAESVRGIDNVRGNHAPLAGVYCVYALQKLANGENRGAARAFVILKKDFSDDSFFAKLWDRDNLTDTCAACASKPGVVTCDRCKGSGKVPASGGKLKVNGRSPVEMKPCLVCHGTGKIKAADSVCSVCGGSGRVISKTAVSENLKKALKREKMLVSLKCVQCALSFRPLWENDER